MVFEASKITATLVGRVVAPADVKFDGGLTELRVAVNHRKKDASGEYVDDGTTWVTIKANNEYGKPLQEFGKGDLVKVTDADFRAREFTKRDGSQGLGIEVRFGSVELLEKQGSRETTSAGAW